MNQPCRITLPLPAISEANSHDVWQAKHRRAKARRMAACMHVRALPGVKDLAVGSGTIVVTMTRLMKKGQKRFDDDNLASAFKAIRDGVADAIGLNDRSPRFKWVCAQERAERLGMRIEISVEP